MNRRPAAQPLSPPDEVIRVARRHVEGLPPPPPEWAWELAEGRRVPGGWYFDYQAERLSPRRGPGTGFGFAPGFLVADDGPVRVVGWGELRAVHGLPEVN